MTELQQPRRVLSTFEVLYYLVAFVSVVGGFWYLVFFT